MKAPLLILVLLFPGSTWAQSVFFGTTDVDRSITIPDSPSVDVQQQFTLEAWIRPTQAIADSGLNFIFSKNVNGTGFALTSTQVGDSRRFFFESGNASVASNAVLGPDRWTHVAATNDGTNLRIYVNGILDVTGPTAVATANAIDLRIGSSVFGQQLNWRGRLDEMRVWNRALAVDEIGSSMRDGVAGAAAGLVVNLRADEDSGVLLDSSGNGNDGVIAGVQRTACGSPAATNSSAERCSATIQLVAGNVDIGDGRPALQGFLSQIGGLVADTSGALFISDRSEARVRRIDPTTGLISTAAGTGENGPAGNGGPATEATLDRPGALAIDTSGNLYIAEETRIRSVSAADHTIRLVTDQKARHLQIDGSSLYVTNENQVLQIDVATGSASVLAGDGMPGFSGDGGPATLAQLSFPDGLALVGNRLFIADTGNRRVRVVDLDTGTIDTYAGSDGDPFDNPGNGGPATDAAFWGPLKVVHLAGSLYMLDSAAGGIGGQDIRRIDLNTGLVEAFVGTDGVVDTFTSSAGQLAPFDGGLVIDQLRRTYVSPLFNLPLNFNTRKTLALRLDITTGQTTEITGDGGFSDATVCSVPAREAALLVPTDVLLEDENTLLIADTAQLRRLDLINGTISSFVDLGVVRMVIGDDGFLYVASRSSGNQGVYRIDLATGDLTGLSAPGFSQGEIIPDGTPIGDAILFPLAVGLMPNGDLLIGETTAIYRLNMSNMLLTRVAGNGDFFASGDGGDARDAGVGFPTSFAVNAAGDIFYPDANSFTIRRINGQNNVIESITQPFVLGGNSADLAFDREGNILISDLDSRRLYRLDPDSQALEIIAGLGGGEGTGDGGPAIEASFDSPGGIDLDADGNLYLTDIGQFAVRRIGSDASLFAIDLNPDDRFGTATAISDNDLAIGIPNRSSAGGTGAVAVYRNNGCRVERIDVLEIPSGFVSQGMGRSVAMRNGVLVVGAGDPLPSARAKGNYLQAAIFRRLQDGWQFDKVLDPPGRTPGDEFGAAIDLDGETIFVGAPSDSEMGIDAGAVYQIPLNNFGVTNMTKIMSCSPASGQNFGAALASSPTKFAAGGPGGSVGGSVGNALGGLACLYDQINDNLENPIAVIGDDEPGSEFGGAIDLDGDQIAVGAPGMNDGEGGAFVFAGNPPLLLQVMSPPDPTLDGRFGTGVGFTREGLLIGAPGTLQPGQASGTVYNYDRNLMSLAGRVDATGEQAELGSSIASDGGDRAALGAPGSSQSRGDAVLIDSDDRLFDADFEQ